MADNTKIEWTDATWSVVTGCTKISPGCANCYIERTPPFRTKGRYFVRGHIPLVFHDDRLDQPLRWKRPRRIFVNSLSDLFHDDIPDQFIGKVFAVMAEAHWHVFQVLTKRPERMRDWSRGVAHYPKGDSTQRPVAGWPPNVWLGVSVENQHWADVRVPVLLDTPAAVRWVSYEPALGPVDFTDYLPYECLFRRNDGTTGLLGPALDWIVVGGESGPGARPFDLAWSRAVIEAGRVAGVPVFVKQLGAHAIAHGSMAGTGHVWFKDRKGGDPAEWPDDIRVRQYPSI